MTEKITQGDVAVLLGSFEEFDEIDYTIKECATKGCVAVVYFYENKLIKVGNKNGIIGEDWYWERKMEVSDD
jgi:hypothetical protein